ncbi:MAG TPA: HNH endonuclease [Dehalococcoidia bacterium]|nr:HNH endonuclease [Dehalococcoidia bacterium]
MPIDGVSDVVRYGRELGFTGLKASRRFVWRVCKICEEGSWIREDGFREICKICSIREIFKSWLAKSGNQKGNANPNWKGGQTVDNHGYTLIRLHPDHPFYPMAKSNGYVPEHRLIMAKKLGRCLESWEIVHHIDGKRGHNSEMNLELGSQRTHKLSYADGYRRGYKDGQKSKIGTLEQEIRLLRFQIRELRIVIQPELRRE